jgi:hypothetical protein
MKQVMLSNRETVPKLLGMFIGTVSNTTGNISFSYLEKFGQSIFAKRP